MLADYASSYATSIANLVDITDPEGFLTVYYLIEDDVNTELDPWTEFRLDVAQLSEHLRWVAAKLAAGTVLDGDADLFGGLTIGEALWAVVYEATKLVRPHT